MGRIIRGQVITSTALDSHGEQIPEEVIRKFFDQLPEESYMQDSHDATKPPVARGFNKQLERLEHGGLAIKLDLEVLDEEAFQRSGGVSIAYTRTTLRIGTSAPVLRILVNPRQFDVGVVADAVGKAIPEEICVDVTERVEKADVVQVAIVIIVVLGVDALRETWSGFWNQAGGEIYDYLKRTPRKDASEGGRRVHLEFPVSWSGHTTRVILAISPSVTRSELAQLDRDVISGTVATMCRGALVERVIGRIEPGPRVIFEQLIDSSGRSRRL